MSRAFVAGCFRGFGVSGFRNVFASVPRGSVPRGRREQTPCTPPCQNSLHLLVETDAIVQRVAPDRHERAAGRRNLPRENRPRLRVAPFIGWISCEVLGRAGDDRELPSGQRHCSFDRCTLSRPTAWYTPCGSAHAVEHVLAAARQRRAAEAEPLLDLDRRRELTTLRIVAGAAELFVEQAAELGHCRSALTRGHEEGRRGRDHLHIGGAAEEL